MFDDLFTTYSSLDSPPIERKTSNLKRIDTDLYKRNTTLNINSSAPNQDLDWQETSDPFSFKTDEPKFENKKQNNPSIQKEHTILKGPKAFEEAFNKALEINPSIIKYKSFLVRTAKKESNFNSSIQNTAGAPYYGYFQMGKNEIAVTTKLSVEKFRNDPVSQILGACKLYEMNLGTIKKIGMYDIGKEQGYSDDALVAGAWLGGPGGVKKYLLGKGDPSDAHWYNGKGGTSVGKRMKEFNS